MLQEANKTVPKEPQTFQFQIFAIGVDFTVQDGFGVSEVDLVVVIASI